VIQARTDEKGHTHNTLKKRIDDSFGVVTSQLNDTVALSDISEEGRKIKIVTGILRNTGEGWDFITDAYHNRINSTVVESDDSGITLNYGFTAKKILSFVATPDETLAHAGFFVGASVGTTKAIIEMSKK